MARNFHLELAHDFWKKVLTPGDLAVDATCGNGHDTLALAKIGARVIACDIQKKAIEATGQRTRDYPITFFHGCHSQLDVPEIKLLVYNLGYLPSGDKSLTTRVETTLQSLKNLLPRITGAVTITCYPGHPEGAREQEAILAFCSTLDWDVLHFSRPNKPTAPTVTILRPIVKLS